MRTRHSVLGDPGDLAAKPGTQPWATAMRLRIQSKLKEREDAEESLGSARDAFVKYAAWRQLRDCDGHPFATWDLFCETRKPFGLGITAAELDAEVERRINGHGGDRRSKEARQEQGDNITLKSRGTDPDYLLARLDRDNHKELAARVRTGELSAYQAGRLAGFRNCQTKTALEYLRHWWKKASPKERAQFQKDPNGHQ